MKKRNSYTLLLKSWEVKGKSASLERCIDAPLLKESKAYEGGEIDKGRLFQSLPVKGIKDCEYRLTLARGIWIE